MKDTRAEPVPLPSFSTTALQEWTGHVDAILRGVAHALNNRAAALSAAIQLGRDPAEAPGVMEAILEPELVRVAELESAVRSIGIPRGGDEAFAPADAAGEAMQVLRLHAEQRERGVSIEARGASPVRTQRWMFVRALVALSACGSGTRVDVSDDGDWVVARADCGGACASSAYVRELASAMGGGPLDDGTGFRVPSLASIRRREGR